MKPPTPGRDIELVRSIIASNAGIKLDEIVTRTSLWRGELFPIIAQLIDLKIVDRIEGRLFVRERRKKQPAPPPTFWSRLRSRAA